MIRTTVLTLLIFTFIACTGDQNYRKNDDESSSDKDSFPADLTTEADNEESVDEATQTDNKNDDLQDTDRNNDEWDEDNLQLPETDSLIDENEIPDEDIPADIQFKTCDFYNPVTEISTVKTKRLNELSGIVFSRKNPGIIWAHNDSDGDSIVYALTETGELLGTTILQDLKLNDWEDIAIGPCEIGGTEECLFIADTGDNSDGKPEVGLVRFKEPKLDGITPFDEITITDYTYYRMTYEDRPHDCESLIIHPDGNRYFFSKEREERDTHIYKFPTEKEGELYIAKKVGSLSLKNGLIAKLNLATAADIHPDGSRIVIRTYSDIFEFRVDPLKDFITELMKSERIDLVPGDIIKEQQGEAIAFNPFTGSIVHVGENPGQVTNAPIFELSCN